jgi:hypothetical protein
MTLSLERRRALIFFFSVPLLFSEEEGALQFLTFKGKKERICL